MRIHPIKLIYSIIIISGVCIKKLSAQILNADTTKLLASAAKKTIEFKPTVIDPNVIFPESLQDYKEQSLGYIENFSDKKRNFLLRTYQTGKKYFPKVAAILKRYQLPEELKVLIALESGFSANAVSKAGAVGYWQIMDGVAKEYGLQISSANNQASSNNNSKDERTNFTKSTLAAAKYFRDRKLNFNNDILLMVASYNCGMGTVRNAIKKCRIANPDFWDIKNLLPKETRNYVMNFITLNVIFENFENFTDKKLLFAPKTVYIPFEIPVYINQAAEN
jgi:membrane-bound lytic murein transglycosylase D